MLSLGDDFRSRSTEQLEAAITLFESPDFAVDPTKQMGFVVAKVTANMLQVLSEVVDYLHGTDKMNAGDERRAKLMEKSNAIRTAGASGNWDEFDRLVREFGTSSPTGSD